MNKKELLETLEEEIRNIVISHKKGAISEEEYFEKMTAYNEIVKAVM